MIFFGLLDFIIAFCVIMIFGTQVIVPAIKNTAMFPFFRKQGKLEAEEISLNQKDVEQKLEYKLEQRKQSNLKEGEHNV